MDRYACVVFEGEEANEQRQFLMAMNGTGIIVVSQDDIDLWHSEQLKCRVKQVNRLVLHDKDEVQRFKNVMETFFPDREYRITDNPDNRQFKRWLERKTGQKSFPEKGGDEE